ncbi:hypothetical protein IAG44_20550 [Streptomyces roseirectus]|uniref:Uncharacterized protein n=1 Tax=Streptomyces roseirectus TaxID=2768066 RepID=A0A7H0IFL8_9ACTN|nr:hypothetical protein [Streptomyces roseirectus]QNP71584.1 hypothetical protein IAG44_20550 [Streptomyces roseirectus]
METPQPRSDDPDADRAELTITIRVSGRAAQHLRRGAAVRQKPIEEIAADCVNDEIRRPVYDMLYRSGEDYATALEGLAKRLALIVRDLGALPSSAATEVIALAAAEQGGPLPYEWRERVINQLAGMWQGRTTEFGKRPDGSFGPLDNIKVDAVVTPAQWDALGRIGQPGSLGSGAQKALEAGIAVLDR